ncbi:MAG TPA: signal peptidase I [Candidatus Paceibacterota bacterium]|nr:signal peptidase I [Candidatus Paceibacterota bacterium]
MEDNRTTTSHPVPPVTPPKKDREQGGGFFSELFKFALIALFIVLPFRIFIAQPFIVNGASMDPTFKSGDYLIVDQLSYRFENPPRGSVVVFKYPKDTTKYFIKRIIGLPGETVSIQGSSVTIKNAENPAGFTLDEPYIQFPKTDDNLTVTLGPTQYFVMGDNRLGSSDSRAWGPVDKSLIIGRPILRLFPLGEIGIFPGGYDETGAAAQS